MTRSKSGTGTPYQVPFAELARVVRNAFRNGLSGSYVTLTFGEPVVVVAIAAVHPLLTLFYHQFHVGAAAQAAPSVATGR